MNRTEPDIALPDRKDVKDSKSNNPVVKNNPVGATVNGKFITSHKLRTGFIFYQKKKMLNRMPKYSSGATENSTQKFMSSPVMYSPSHRVRIGEKFNKKRLSYVLKVKRRTFNNVLSLKARDEDQLIRGKLNNLVGGSSSPILSNLLIKGDNYNPETIINNKLASSSVKVVNKGLSSPNCLNQLVSDFLTKGTRPRKLYEILHGLNYNLCDLKAKSRSRWHILSPIRKENRDDDFGKEGKYSRAVGVRHSMFLHFPVLQHLLDKWLKDLKSSQLTTKQRVIGKKLVVTIMLPPETENHCSFQRLKKRIIQQDHWLSIRTATGKYHIAPQDFGIKQLLIKILWEELYFSQSFKRKILIEAPGKRFKPLDFEKEHLNSTNAFLVIKTGVFYKVFISDYLKQLF